jgi:uncharacterized protein YcfL
MKQALTYAVLATVVLVGCKSTSKTEAASAGVMNTKCPMSGRAVTTGPTTDFKGGKVMFCCDGCKGKWAGLSDAERSERLDKAK